MEITRPLENTNIRLPFFGKFPYKVGIYYAIDNVKKGKGILSKTLKSFAEKPVFVNRKIVEKNSENLKEYLKAKGFFSAVVKGYHFLKYLLLLLHISFRFQVAY